MIEQISEEVNYQKGYDKGWEDAQEVLSKKFEKILGEKTQEINWIEIKDKTPEKGRRLLYFFEGTGVWLGFYYGIDEEYCSETGHVFGCQHGFLTGDVTHWCYIPTYPKGEDWRDEADREFAKEAEEEINSFKKTIK